jgi:DNA-directed RNA polymerase beta' subunit
MREGLTIRINLALAKAMNEDFDGDENNIHIPQSELAITDCTELAAVDKNILNPQDGKPMIVLIQDTLLGIWLLTQDDRKVSKEQAWQYLIESNVPIKKWKEENKGVVTGKEVVSYLLPSSFTLKGIVRKGKIIVTLNKKSIHQIIVSLVHTYHSNLAIQFINSIQLLAISFLTHTGYSVGYQDCIVPKIQFSTLERYLKEAECIEQSIHHSEIRERKIQSVLNKAKDAFQKLTSDSIKKNNKFLGMISSGSKGNWVNLVQIGGILGQQNVEGNRIKQTIDEGTRTLSCYPSSFHNTNNTFYLKSKYQSRGFIFSSFMKGLTPQEFFFHSSAGREGIINTACSTADSGYLQRKMVKLLEDVKINYDASVRDAKGNIIQFVYGQDGLDGSLLSPHQPIVNIPSLVSRLNNE